MTKKLFSLVMISMFNLHASDYKYDLAAHYMQSVKTAKSANRESIDKIREQKHKEAILGLLVLPTPTQRLDDFFALVSFIQKHGL